MAVIRDDARTEGFDAPTSRGPTAVMAPAPTPAPLEPETAPLGRVKRLRLAKAWLVASDAVWLAVAMVVTHRVLDRVDGPTATAGDGVGTVVCFVAILIGLAQQRTYKARYLALRRDEWARVGRGVVVGLVLTIIADFLVGFVTPKWQLWLVVSAPLLLCVNRELARRVFTRMRVGGRLVRRAVVVGANTEADELSVELMTSRELGYDVVGAVSTTDAAGEPVPWPRVLAAVEKALEETSAGNVILATTAVDLDTAGYLTRRLTDAGLHVEMCVPLRDIDVTRLQLRPLGRFPVFYVEPVSRSGWRQAAKRVFDVVIASVALLVSAPFLAVAALAIVTTSRGPVVFRQKRVGRNGTRFDVLKLRTMVVDAEARLDEVRALNEATGPIFKIRNDPRITRVGRVLRKFSIDELPQLWNVVRGEMSLVGPRPALPEEMDGWTPELRERLHVRPGITGMWQVSGRTDASGGDYVRLDLYYVDNWSLLIDLIILLKTVPAVVSGRGAY